MAELTKKDFSVLEKYIGNDLCERWIGIKKKADANNHITIANTGLFSSGKSQLFNALIDRTEDERFPVGTIPTTKIGDREKFTDKIEFIDTPGIDANSEDDDVAFKMIVESDIILITHNVNIGMLGRTEFDWIQSIAYSMPEEERIKRLIFVATWIDAIADKEDYKKIIAEIKKQLNCATGVELIFWEVSSKRYYAARKNNNENLRVKSNIPGLREFLIEYASRYEKNLAVEKEITIIREETLTILSQKAKDIRKDISLIEKKHEKKGKEKIKLWTSKLERFNNMKDGIEMKLKRIENEYGSLSDEVNEMLSEIEFTAFVIDIMDM